MQVRELLHILNEIAPLSLAEDYDNVGMLLGNEDTEIKGMLLGLDLTEDIIDEANNVQANVIITHHPFIFNPIKRIDTREKTGRIIEKLIRGDICAIAMHTNMDKASNGLNDYLAEIAGIQNVKVLEDESQCYCVSVYVPREKAQAVKEAMFLAGAGSIGNYQDCAFETQGIGQFEPKFGAHPSEGHLGTLEKVEETKIEVYCDAHILGAVVYAMMEVHPYEKPVYYAFKSKGISEYGFGRYGELSGPISLGEYCRKLEDSLNIKIRYIGDSSSIIRTVGVCSGAGSGMYDLGAKLGLDAFITGDIKHNITVDARGSSTALIDAGHFGTEVIFKNILNRHLQTRLNELQYSVNIINSQMEKSPWSYV